MIIADHFLSVSPFSRPGLLRQKTLGLVMHWSGWVGQPVPAANVRNYFEMLGKSSGLAASSNFVIGWQGEILRLMPDAEISYCSGWYDYSPEIHSRFMGNPNACTLSVEVCAKNERGEYTPEAYDSQVQLAAFICNKYELNPARDILRHHDVCGPSMGKKDCPRYFVNNPAAWDQFKADVKELVK